MKTYSEIKHDLTTPVPQNLIKHREQGGRDIAYINVTDYKDLLDVRAGKWTAEIRDCRQIGESLCTVVRITIHASDGDFFQDGSGMEPLNGTGYGDPFSNAYAQSFRRACETHGLSRELWHKEDVGYTPRPAQSQQSNGERQFEQPTVSDISDPIARNMTDLVTIKQLGMIRAIAREAGVDHDAECETIFKCKTDELGKKAASAFIQHLQGLQNQPRQTSAAPRDPIPF